MIPRRAPSATTAAKSDKVDGLMRVYSQYSAAETFTRLEAALEAHGIRIFCHIDHSGEAAAVGMHMLPSHLIVFGNPRAGTPFMNESQTMALDLPLKALVFEDKSGAVWLVWNDPQYLAQRHGISSPAAPRRGV